MTKNKQKIVKPKQPFDNAQKKKQQYPNTFWAPDKELLDSIKPGKFVKVCVGRERFWVKVEQRKGESITGSVTNALLLVDEHGLKLYDWIRFKPCHVYNVGN